MAPRWQLAAIGLAGILLGLLGGYFFLSGGRVGMVNMDTILTKSKPGKDYQSKLEEREKALLAELDKVGTAQEKAVKREQFRAELTALQKDYTEKVLQQADVVIAKVAKRHRIQSVFVQGTLRYAAVDLTDEVLKALEK